MRIGEKAPTPYSPDHNYNKDMKKAQKHLENIIKGSYHAGQMQHMGGVASLVGYLDDAQYGYGRKVKDELIKVLDLFYKYHETEHAIYKLFGADLLRHATDMTESMEDGDDKMNAIGFLGFVVDYVQQFDRSI